MSYQVLARKWRPRNFQDMVGQEPILRMLANAFEQKRIHHAYLFTGTRGVGKTTIARIIAKCLNCATGVTPVPCGTCHACTAIDNGQFLDLYEVDAASRTKVEDTRELLDNVLYPPTQGRYKVYLIDEVHMLSNHSFNALLKTLEEPPGHVKFILATTDPKRLPVTILSRCLQFHLKRITLAQIAKHLAHICQAENVKHDMPALEKVAHAADGSMRDALSLLDQAIAFGHGAVSAQDVTDMLGSIAHDDVLPLLNALAAQNAQQVFAVIQELTDRAPDFQQVLEELIRCFHHIAIAQFVPQASHIDPSLTQLSARFTPEDVQLYYQIALLARRDLPLAASPVQGFEMALLRMLAFKPGLATSTPATPPTETKVALATHTTEAKAAVATNVTEMKATLTANPTEAKVTTNDTEKQAQTPVSNGDIKWRDMLPKLELTGMAYALAANCTLAKLEDNKVILALSANHQPMLNPRLKERITEALGRYLGTPARLEITISSEDLITPVKQQQQEDAQRLTDAKQKVLQDPRIRKFIDTYDATVDVSLL